MNKAVVLVICAVELDEGQENALALFLQSCMMVSPEVEVAGVVTCTNQPEDMVDGYEVLMETAEELNSSKAIILILDNAPGKFNMGTVDFETYMDNVAVSLEVVTAKENGEIH